MDLRWDPFGELANLRERMRALEQGLRQGSASSEAPKSRPWAPRGDIRETDHSLVFEAELPGVGRDDIEIEGEGDRLTIRGERKPSNEGDLVRVERPYGPFHRSFAIGVPIDHGRVTARYRDGVLGVALPKAGQQHRQRAKVPVE
jgi:HSP20 family protein